MSKVKTQVSTRQTAYNKPNGKIIVNSHFSNNTPLSELIYQIISKNIVSNVA